MLSKEEYLAHLDYGVKTGPAVYDAFKELIDEHFKEQVSKEADLLTFFEEMVPNCAVYRGTEPGYIVISRGRKHKGFGGIMNCPHIFQILEENNRCQCMKPLDVLLEFDRRGWLADNTDELSCSSITEPQAWEKETMDLIYKYNGIPVSEHNRKTGGVYYFDENGKIVEGVPPGGISLMDSCNNSNNEGNSTG